MAAYLWHEKRSAAQLAKAKSCGEAYRREIMAISHLAAWRKYRSISYDGIGNNIEKSSRKYQR
jgi:hypothetical protein